MTTTTSRKLLTSAHLLTESSDIISSVAYYAGKDVRRTLELLFVCNGWQKALSLESCPHLWKLHATECRDPEGKLLLKAAAHNLPHLLNVLMVKFEGETGNASPKPLASIKDADGRTPLHFIAHSTSAFSIETVKQLIQLGVDVSAKDQIISVGETACHAAAAAGNVEMIKLFLECDKTLVEAIDESKWTPLFSAVHHGQMAACKLLLSQHNDTESESDLLIKNRDINGCNIFHHAAQSGSVEMMNFLCNVALNNSNGNNNNLQGDRGQYISKLMVEPAQLTGKTPFMIAVETGKLDVVKAVVRRAGVLMAEAVNAQEIDGETALMLAARQGFTEIVDFLLKNYPNLDQDLKNKEMRTALDVASAFRKKEVVTLLNNGRKTGSCCC